MNKSIEIQNALKITYVGCGNYGFVCAPLKLNALRMSFSLLNFLDFYFFYLFSPCRKSVIRDHSTEDDVHLVHRELDVDKQTKSVQVEKTLILFNLNF